MTTHDNCLSLHIIAFKKNKAARLGHWTLVVGIIQMCEHVLGCYMTCKPSRDLGSDFCQRCQLHLAMPEPCRLLGQDLHQGKERRPPI